jgi:hypothetical protein
VLLTIEVGPTEAGNQEEAQNDYENILFWQFRADVQKHCHRSQYKANQYAAGIEVCAQEHQV